MGRQDHTLKGLTISLGLTAKVLRNGEYMEDIQRIVNETDRFGSVIAPVKNAIGHSLRQLIKRKKGIPLIPNESKQELFPHLPLNERKQADVTARQLFSDFHLSNLYEQFCRQLQAEPVLSGNA